MIKGKNVTVEPIFDSGNYIDTFTISAKDLNSFHIPSDSKFWTELSSVICRMTEVMLKIEMKKHLNEEAFNDRYEKRLEREEK